MMFGLLSLYSSPVRSSVLTSVAKPTQNNTLVVFVRSASLGISGSKASAALVTAVLATDFSASPSILPAVSVEAALRLKLLATNSRLTKSQKVMQFAEIFPITTKELGSYGLGNLVLDAKALAFHFQVLKTRFIVHYLTVVYPVGATNLSSALSEVTNSEDFNKVYSYECTHDDALAA
jgi:hypothetical protein